MPPEAVNGGDTLIAGRSPVCKPRINRQDVRQEVAKEAHHHACRQTSDQMSDTGAIPGRKHASQIANNTQVSIITRFYFNIKVLKTKVRVTQPDH